MLWWRLAWRNLWRNRGRTLITAAALALGFLAAVVMVGVSDGMTAQMVENGTGLLEGQLQVHAPGYRPERSLYATLGGDAGIDVDAAVRAVEGEPGVVAAAPRVYGGGLVSAGSETQAVMLLGVDPARERRVSRVLGALVAGRAPRPGAREVLLGRETARKLGAAPGAEVVVVAPAADGSMGNDLYRVSGVFRTGMPDLDDGLALLPIGALQSLLALEPGRVHEIAASVRDPWAAPAVAAGVGARLASLGLHPAVEPWTAFRPELADYARLARASNGMIVGIVFLMAVFGVANTMLMGTYERRREFAVVRALGTSAGAVAREVVYEGLVLGALSLAAGALLTAPLMYALHRSPPDLGGLFGDFTMAGALVRPVLRVEYSATAALGSAAALLVTAVAAAVYPAWRAARIPPADALAGR